ncbi:Coatomer subunit beta, partial [Perkinsus olseni]
MIYWELCEKTNDDGSLKEEMILVVNALRNDLMHPNEYVRGSTLRLLCKLKYYRILEPLTEAILRNLTHRHSYVRRNAVMCVYAIVSTFGEEMMPTASQEVENLLLVEGDLSTKRNAFLMLMLTPHNEEKAMSYVFSMQDQVANLGDICQLVILELIRRVNKHRPEVKGALLKVVYTLRESPSPAVQYETANTLVILSKSHVAIGAAAEAYVNLVVTQADNNVKLIVLDRIDLLRKRYKQAMEPLVMDLLRGLSCPAVEVRRKILDICTPLVNSRNIADVVGMLKKELIKTQDTSTSEGNTEYRRLLIRALHLSTTRVGDATYASQVVSVLLDILTEQTDVKASDSAAVAADIVMFVRETIIRHEQLRESILTRLAESLNEIRQSRVIRGCLWLLGEFSP